MSRVLAKFNLRASQQVTIVLANSGGRWRINHGERPVRPWRSASHSEDRNPDRRGCLHRDRQLQRSKIIAYCSLLIAKAHRTKPARGRASSTIRKSACNPDLSLATARELQGTQGRAPGPFSIGIQSLSGPGEIISPAFRVFPLSRYNEQT
jgi:hypothetical protein